MDNSETFYLTPLEIKDVQSLHTLIHSNFENFKLYLPKTVAQNVTLKDSETYIIRKAEENKKKNGLTLAIKEKQTNTVAGLIILKNIDLIKAQGEFAYCISKTFEGRGWMTQTVKNMAQFASKELGLKTLQIITHKTNIGSSKVAEKSGFVWKCTLKNEFIPPMGTPLDMELYERYL